jgi:hypothetical protein
MKRKLILCLAFVSLVPLSKGQDVLGTRDKYPEMRYLGLSGSLYYNTYNQVKGSAYLSETWTKGIIILTNGVALKDVSFKIDFYTQQLLVYHEILKRVIAIDNINLRYLVFNDNDVERKFIKFDGLKTLTAAKNGLIVEALTEGKISFYKVFYKNKISLLEPVKPYIDEFTDATKYYLLKGSVYIPVNPGKRNLIKIFPEYKADIKQHIRKSHLKLRKEKDFSMAVSYINALEK